MMTPWRPIAGNRPAASPVPLIVVAQHLRITDCSPVNRSVRVSPSGRFLFAVTVVKRASQGVFHMQGNGALGSWRIDQLCA